jgi:hypothetical protein
LDSSGGEKPENGGAEKPVPTEVSPAATTIMLKRPSDAAAPTKQGVGKSGEIADCPDVVYFYVWTDYVCM